MRRWHSLEDTTHEISNDRPLLRHGQPLKRRLELLKLAAVLLRMEATALLWARDSSRPYRAPESLNATPIDIDGCHVTVTGTFRTSSGHYQTLNNVLVVGAMVGPPPNLQRRC